MKIKEINGNLREGTRKTTIELSLDELITFRNAMYYSDKNSDLYCQLKILADILKIGFVDNYTLETLKLKEK